MKRDVIIKFLAIGLVVSTFGLTSCSNPKPTKPACNIEQSVRMNPRGSKEEKMAFYQGEIHKYEEAIEREDKKINQGLRERNMCEVRQAKNRKARYQKKIQYYQNELEKLY